MSGDQVTTPDQSAISPPHPGPVPEPIAITGIGLVLPGARTVTQFWDHLNAGRSQLGPLGRVDPDAEGLAVYAGGEIGDIDYASALPTLPARHAAKYSREILTVLVSTDSALRDSGLGPTDVDPRRLSIIESTSRWSLEWWLSRANKDRAEFVGTGAMFCGLGGSSASLSAIHVGARGLVTTLTSACVGGHHAIGLALRELRSRSSDAVLVSGHDFPLVPDVLRTFLARGPAVLSRERAEPSRAIRPYSRDREGMVLGEGAMTLTLERASTARTRGARVYAHVLEHRAMNEAAHATSMDPTGKLTAELVTDTLDDAGRTADEVGYYCGHGTATWSNDIAESRTLRVLYPRRPAAALPPISSH